MVASLKRFLVGSPMRTEQAIHERLTKKTALAVFSSDALSSTAYASEEILLVLAVAAAYGQTYSYYKVVPISIVIAIVLGIVATSYRQTVHAYPSGGGAYIVAKENLGEGPGLTAAAALLVDYILTVAVSIAAGVAAITSAFPALFPHRVAVGIGIVTIITLANLRGIRESGALFAPPTYLFIFSLGSLILVGLFRTQVLGLQPAPAPALPGGTEPLTLLLLLQAFS